MTRVFFTSDLHVGHDLVAEHRWGLAFPGIDKPPPDFMTSWHDQLLAQNWDAAVAPGDTVWVLGDISAGGSRSQRNALEWVAARNGTKHLVAGNHDDCHPMHRESYRWQRIYLGLDKPDAPAPFASVQMAAKRRVSWEASENREGGHATVFLSHFPYRADRGTKPRYPEWRLKNAGAILLHGHTHFAQRLSYDVDVWNPKLAETPQIHVGLDAWDLAPVPYAEVRDMVFDLLGVPHGKPANAAP